MKIEIGSLVEIKIDKIVFGGEGLGFLDDFAIFVPMSVPGDVLKCEVISVKKTYGRAIIKKIITPSPDRVELNKISFEDFGGCDFAMMNYPAQLKYKKQMVDEVLSKIAKTNSITIPEVIGADNYLNYRNKVIEPFALYKDKIITGFFKKKSHEVFEVKDNFLNSTLGNKIILEAKKLLNNSLNKISVYDEETHKGILRHIMVRTNSKNEAMVVLVVNLKNFNNEELSLKIKSSKLPLPAILTELKNKFSEIKSVYVSLNTDKTNFALGRENILYSGVPTISENLFGIEFNISPTSFFQINYEQTKKLYSKAIELAVGLENKVVVDAYAGTGTIGMILSKNAKKVYSIEIVKSAVEDGIKTLAENKIKNVEFIIGAVETELPKLLEKEKVDTIFLDPPRKGVEESALIKIAETGIKEIIYVSCNPSTFARDLLVLNNYGYTLEKIAAVDMFPCTGHVEVVGRIVLMK